VLKEERQQPVDAIISSKRRKEGGHLMLVE
jgi:hypothetical protein